MEEGEVDDRVRVSGLLHCMVRNCIGMELDVRGSSIELEKSQDWYHVLLGLPSQFGAAAGLHDSLSVNCPTAFRSPVVVISCPDTPSPCTEFGYLQSKRVPRLMMLEQPQNVLPQHISITLMPARALRR